MADSTKSVNVAERDVQLAMIEGLDRPVGPLLGSVFTGSNADLIKAVAPLYLTGSVLDTTYGRGRWWDRFTPSPFVAHDLELDGVDFRALPHDGGSFDAVCFDPPYVPAGGQRSSGATGDELHFREAYGLVRRTWRELHELIDGGLAECARVSRRWVLVKCTDYVDGGRFNLGHLRVLDTARDLELMPHDLVIHHTGSGPGGHNIWTAKRARRCHSYLLVFEVRGGR